MKMINTYRFKIELGNLNCSIETIKKELKQFIKNKNKSYTLLIHFKNKNKDIKLNGVNYCLGVEYSKTLKKYIYNFNYKNIIDNIFYFIKYNDNVKCQWYLNNEILDIFKQHLIK